MAGVGQGPEDYYSGSRGIAKLTSENRGFPRGFLMINNGLKVSRLGRGDTLFRIPISDGEDPAPVLEKCPQQDKFAEMQP
jgi:hypothetical protein